MERCHFELEREMCQNIQDCKAIRKRMRSRAAGVKREIKPPPSAGNGRSGFARKQHEGGRGRVLKFSAMLQEHLKME